MFDLDSFTTSFQNEDGTGILLVDKPTGMTSHDVVAKVRRQTGIKRVGHAGTLDPLATGLLIVLVGREYTKLQDQFLKQDKEYECQVELGRTTDSFDSDGTTLTTTPWQTVQQISKEEVTAALAELSGVLQQTVPAFSAVKVGGQKMYELARRGKALPDLPVRQVEVKEIELLSFEKNEKSQKVLIAFRAFVSSGTYIRSLASELGKKLGVGGTVVALRRTKIGTLSLEAAKEVEAFGKER